MEGGWRLSERPLRVVSETSFDPIAAVDDERRYLLVNAAATRLLAAPAQQVLGRRIDDFTPGEHLARLEELWADVERTGMQQGQHVVLRDDGSRTIVRYRAVRGFADGVHLIAAREIPAASKRAASLTPRQAEILQRAADGLSGRDIANVLGLSPTTIKTHFHNIYAKLAAPDRASAVADGLRRGLIE
jgi:PAS domain S-box-containing protein